MSFFLSDSLKDTADFLILIQSDQAWMKDAWTKEQWESSRQSQYWASLAFVDDTVVGFSLIYLPPDDPAAHLLKIATDPIHRAKGFGTKLLSENFQFLRENCRRLSAFLEVREANQNAIDFYLKIGFIRSHLKKNFYHDGESAWAMHKAL